MAIRIFVWLIRRWRGEGDVGGWGGGLVYGLGVLVDWTAGQTFVLYCFWVFFLRNYDLGNGGNRSNVPAQHVIYSHILL